ncbi:MAG: hypothetical protein ACFCU6_06755 [Balneolaceae bacterium]
MIRIKRNKILPFLALFLLGTGFVALQFHEVIHLFEENRAFVAHQNENKDDDLYDGTCIFCVLSSQPFLSFDNQYFFYPQFTSPHLAVNEYGFQRVIAYLSFSLRAPPVL